MGLIEVIKAAAIRSTDCLNRLNDPFEDFTRPTFNLEGKKLSELESDFYSDLLGNFWGCEGQVLLHRISLPSGSPLDTGDQAIWHGVYTGMLALRYHLSEAEKKNDTYGHLIDALKGLQLHQTIHHEAAPRLIRGVTDDLKSFQDDASNDSATGHLFGIYAAWKWGPETLQPVCQQLALGLAAELLGHGHALVGANGKPTTYGALEQGWKTDPLRISLALAIYAVAATLTKKPAFMKAYSDLYTQYGTLACYPKAKLWWLDNQNDTHRAAIHLAILADVTTGDPMHAYMRGLERIRKMVAKEGNVWVNALCAWGCGNTNYRLDVAKDRELAIKVLSEFHLEEKQFNDGKDRSIPSRPQGYCIIPGYNGGPDWRYDLVKWGDVLRSTEPLPRWFVRSQDFFWQRNLRSVDVGSTGAEPDSRLNGGDFLAAYWLSRLTGIVNEND